jgi:hypothetical protein
MNNSNISNYETMPTREKMTAPKAGKQGALRMTTRSYDSQRGKKKPAVRCQKMNAFLDNDE